MLFTFTVSERERQRGRVCCCHAVCGGGVTAASSSTFYCARTSCALRPPRHSAARASEGGHYKELRVGKFDVVSASFVCTNPRNSAKRSRGLFPLTQNKHNAVLSSQSSKSESAARALLLLLLLSLQPIAFEPHRCPLSPPTPALSGCGGRPVSLRPRFPSTVAIASAAVQIRLARGQEVKLHPYYSDVRLIRLPMNKIE